MFRASMSKCTAVIIWISHCYECTFSRGFFLLGLDTCWLTIICMLTQKKKNFFGGGKGPKLHEPSDHLVLS